MNERVWTTILALLTAGACSDAPIPAGGPGAPPPLGAATPPEAEDDAAPSAPAAPEPARCSGTVGRAGDEEIALVSSGLDREASIHVPAVHDGVRPLPLVLVLHPLLLTRKDMRKLVKVERFADAPDHGFIALFPDGVGRSWNAGECCGKAKDRSLDDVGFIRELVEHVASRWCVDRSRIYAMGFSNGAFLAHRLACELPGGLRAIAPVAGTLGIAESSCKPPHPTPVLQIHGTEDELVPFAGGSPKIPRGTSFGTFASPSATTAFWVKANGCGAAGAPYYAEGEVSCVRHDGCRGGASVGLCTVAGGGHQWPGASSLPAMGHVTKDLDATAAAVELFRTHGL
ncbi:MAG: dienelactone hydrolase family protein [Labilithrix sp.]|nr:dienelactone hydrolase family protein [Labilithrix sp.]